MKHMLGGPEIKIGPGDYDPADPADPAGEEWLDARVNEARDRMLGNQGKVAGLLSEMDGAIRVGVLHFTDTWDALAWMLAHQEDATGIRCVLRAIEARVHAEAERVCRDAVIERAEREVAARAAEWQAEADIDRRFYGGVA